MPENTAQQETTAQAGATEPAFTPISSQAELDRIIEQRLTRERQKYAGYAEYKAKAAELDTLKEASKTELERATERATKAEAELAAMKAEAERSAWNAKVSGDTGLPVTAVADLAASSLEELAEKAQRLAELVKPQPAPAVPQTSWDKKSYQPAAPKQSRDLFAEVMAERFK